MNVIWLPGAINDLEAIRDHVASDSPAAAMALVERILARSEQLSLFPRSGRVVRGHTPAHREIFEGPYRIVYRLWDDRIEVFGVVHGARLRE